MHRLRVTGYDVVIGAGALDHLGELLTSAVPADRIVVIADTNVAEHYGARVRRALGEERATLLTIPPGETEKTRARWAELSDAMAAAGVGRDAAVVALGGGVIGDLAGFVAATYMRGIPLVHLPTTLLAMVDASVGGKTAVDTPFGKNLVGAFHRPAAVVIDPTALLTLPRAHVRAGFAEILKHGVIADASYFAESSAAASALIQQVDAAALAPIVRRSIEIKGGVVERDEREAGERQVLNFGHTIAHGIELASDFGVSHGDAVAIGMMAESACGEMLGVTEPGTVQQIHSALVAAGLPVRLPAELDAGAVVAATAGDKKRRGGVARYALPRRIGEMAGADRGWTFEVPAAVALRALR